MEFVGELASASKDITSGKYRITFLADELPNSINKTQGRLTIKATRFKKKRSTDANAYAWLLISKIADIVRGDKEIVYQDMLRKYGQPLTDDDGNPQMISVLASVDVTPFGIYTKFIGRGHVQDKEFAHYLILKGSSKYDTREMSIFIDGVVSEAQELGIDTVPKVDLDKMKEKWRL